MANIQHLWIPWPTNGGFRYVYRSPPMERMNPKAPMEQYETEVPK